MTPNYEALFAECEAGMDKPFPLNCAQRGWEQSENCRLAGGCPKCCAELLPRITITDSVIFTEESRRRIEIAAYRRQHGYR